jgi:HKD family nuclease
MHTVLPTCAFNSWAVKSLRDSLVSELAADKSRVTLLLFFYAITNSGWNEIRKPLLKWQRAKKARVVTVYVGTDHGITDPAAIESMQQAGLDVRLMESYRGIFHPKVVWLKGQHSNLVWVGSNNLTKDGLLHNIEFAVLIKSRNVPADLNRWADVVATGSTRLTAALIASYKSEREKFEKMRAAAKSTTFTWSKKREPISASGPIIGQGDLILEIMPEETRGGNQIQIPKQAALHFFGLAGVGDQTSIRLRRSGTTETRSLVITIFENNTIRLSINELEYRDRPCVIVFHKARRGVVEFEIVPESIFPSRYRALITLCKRQTRAGSRRWEIVQEQAKV